MLPQTHILNGDALKQQFPESIIGDIIIARECLVDGSVKGSNLNEVLATRACFISEFYGGTEQDYYDKTASEFFKILEIDDLAEINLWFEDDLFCQINFWFVVDLLCKNNRAHQVFLVRPEFHNYYGFGGLSKSDLTIIYENRIPITVLKEISSLWAAYQSDHFEKLLDISTRLAHKFPFILAAVKAHIERIPSKGNLGRPAESLIAIMDKLQTEDFGLIYKKFSQQEHIYGYGDLQVKRLYDEILRR